MGAQSLSSLNGFNASRAPSVFLTLCSIWAFIIIAVSTTAMFLAADQIARRMDRDRIHNANETMAMVSMFARNMNRARPHEFVRELIETGQFQRIGVYCSMQKANFDGTTDGVHKSKEPFALAAEAIDAKREVSRLTNDSYMISRPLTNKKGKPNGAVYMVVDRAKYNDVLWSLVDDMAPIAGLVLGIGVVISIIVAYGMTAPIRRLTRATANIAAGRLDTEIETNGPQEIQILSRSVAKMVANLKDNLTEINRLAFTDAVTNLANRAHFTRQGEQAAKKYRRAPGEKIAIVYIDLDGFKSINDTYGHDMGDKALQFFAHKLSETLRETDGVIEAPGKKKLKGAHKNGDAMPARLGGDEFTVLLTGLYAEEDAAVVAERILLILEEPFNVGDVELTMGASIGISMGEGEEIDFATLLTQADSAMYSVKQRGKNGYAIHRG